jgi:hypothetical protein
VNHARLACAARCGHELNPLDLDEIVATLTGFISDCEVAVAS